MFGFRPGYKVGLWPPAQMGSLGRWGSLRFPERHVLEVQRAGKETST